MVVLNHLLELQEDQQHDIEHYIKTLQQRLYPIGIKHIYYDLTYMHKTISSKPMKNTTLLIQKEIFYKNISGNISIEVKNNTGEYKMINKLILYVITLQIVNAIHSDITTIHESFARIAKLQTYMVHDFKNILQFFQLMQHNVTNLHTQKEKEQFIDFLQNSTQPINFKVNKMLALLQIESQITTKNEPKPINIYQFILSIAQQFHLKITAEEKDIVINSDEMFLITVFENIFSNISYKTLNNEDLIVHLSIEKDNNNLYITIYDTGDEFENPDNIFQPFYTTKKDGLGIGMYQVYTIITLLGGSIKAYNKDTNATLLITLPFV